MSTNINDALSQGLLPLIEAEKTTIAFKGIFQVLNSKTLISNPNFELFSKSFTVTTSDLMTDSDTIIRTLQDDDGIIKPASEATWELGANLDASITDDLESITRGNLVSVANADQTSNPAVEKVLLPLTKIQDTNNQFYIAYSPGPEILDKTTYDFVYVNNENYPPFSSFGYPQTKEVSLNTIFPHQKQRVDNFISPFKFGSGYQVKIYPSLRSNQGGYPGPDVNFHGAITSDEKENITSGWIFDYREGTLLFGHQKTGFNPGEKPDLSSYQHPLWIEGYRYIGKTGSAGVGGTIDVATETDLNFDSDNSILSLGNTSVDLSQLGSSFQHLKFTKDFAREEVQFKSSIAIMHNADSDGFPYVTSSCDSWLFLNTIHLTDPNTNDYRGNHLIYGETGVPIIQFPYGYALGFSSSLNSATGSHFPNKHIPSYKLGTQIYPITELDPHTHGFNYGYVTSSNNNRFLYDPSGKSSGSIATELRDYINNNFSDHLSASIELTSSVALGENKTIPLLTVKQIYYGIPSWYYTNHQGGSNIFFSNIDTPFFSSSYHDTGLPMPFTSKSFSNYLGYYITSSEGYSNATGFGSTIYPLRFLSTDSTQYKKDTFTSNNPWNNLNKSTEYPCILNESSYSNYSTDAQLANDSYPILNPYGGRIIESSPFSIRPIFPYTHTPEGLLTQTTPFLTSRVTYDNSPASNNPSTGLVDLQHASITPGQQFQLNIGDVTFKYYISNLQPRNSKTHYLSSSIFTTRNQALRQTKRNTVEILLTNVDSNETLASEISKTTNIYFLDQPDYGAPENDRLAFYITKQSSSFTKNDSNLKNDYFRFKNGVYVTSSGTILSFTSSVECDPSLVNTITFKTGSNPSIVSGSSGFPLAQHEYFVWAYTGSGEDNNTFPHSGLAAAQAEQKRSSNEWGLKFNLPPLASSTAENLLTCSLFVSSSTFLSNSLVSSSHWFDTNNTTVMTMGGGTSTPLINFTEEFQKSLFHISEKLYTGSTGNNWFNSKTGKSMNRFSDDFPDSLFNRGPIWFSDNETLGWASTPWNRFGKSGSKNQPLLLANGTGVGDNQNIFQFVRPSSTIISKIDNQPSYFAGGTAQFKVGARAGHPFPLRSTENPLGSFSYGWYKDTHPNPFKYFETDERVVAYNSQMFPLTLPTSSDIRFGIVGTDVGNLPLDNGSVGQPNPNRRSIIKAYQTEMLRAGYNDVEFGLQEEDALLQFNIAQHQIFTSGGHTLNSDGENTYTIEIQGRENQFLRAGAFGTAEVSVNPLIIPQMSSSISLGQEGEEIIDVVNLYEGFASTDLSSNQTMLFVNQQSKNIKDIEIISDTNPILGGDLNTNGKIIFGGGRINLLSNNNSIISNLSSTNITTTNLDVTNNLNVTNDLNIDGNLTFDGFTFSDGNISVLSGSNIFGSGSGNKHEFTGSIFTSGSITLEDNNELFGTSSFAHTSSLSYGLSGSPDIITSNITSSNLSASGLLFASLSFSPLPHEKQVRSVVYDTASGQFYFTGSYGSGGGSGTGTGFPFSGSAVLTGSLIISNSSPFIQIDSSSTSFGAGKIHNRGGNLYWGDIKIASGSHLATPVLVEDSSPQLGGNLDMQSNSILGNSTSKIILDGSGTSFLSASGDKIEILGEIEQLGNFTSTFQKINVVNSITSSIISASGAIIANSFIGLPSGLISRSSQLPSGIISGAIQIDSDISGSWQGYITGSNIISGAAQIDSDISGSWQGYITGSNIISGAAQIKTNLPSGVISESAQLPEGIISSSLQTFTNITASGEISASGDIKTSGNVFLQLGTFDARAQHVGYDQNTGMLVSTRIIRGERSTIVDDNWEISGSLIVSESGEFLGPVAIGTSATSSTLNVSGNIFISNINDTSTPDNEGILIEASGEDDQTINKIFFQSKAPTGLLNGIEFLHNGSNSNTLNNIPAGTFSITHHDNSLNGDSKFSINAFGKIGIGKNSPLYDVHIGPKTYFDNDVELALGRTIKLGNGVSLSSTTISTNIITSLLNAPIEIGKVNTNADTHIKNNLSVTGSAIIAGRLIVGDRVVSKAGTALLLGDKHKPVKELHIDRGTIFFYSGSTTEISQSSEVAKLEIIKSGSTHSFEFKSGSELAPIRTKQLQIGFGNSGSVQIGEQDQGFIAVHANPTGKFSTVLRAESTVLSGDLRMGSITQKGSGSFAILLDADQVRGDAKFVVESNSPIPGALGIRHFSVSESGETRAHNYFKADEYITTTNITASNNISASGTIITDIINVGNNQNIGSLNVGPSSNKIVIEGGNPSLGSNPQILSTTGTVKIADHLTVSGNLDVTGVLNLDGGTFTSASLLTNSDTSSFLVPTDTASFALLNNNVTFNNIIATGNITAEKYIVSSSVTHMTQSFSSGSTIFGDTLNDTHLFTGSVFISGSNLQLNGLDVLTSSPFSAAGISGSFSSPFSAAGISGSFNGQTGSFITNTQTGSFSTITQLNASSSALQTNINAKAAISSSVLFTNITSSGNISSSGNIIGGRSFFNDDYNILLAASTRPTLTIKNKGGGDISYLGTAVDNADAFIKFEADRSNSNYAVGIDSHDGDFKITSGSTLNDNDGGGNAGHPNFRIQDNKVGINKSTVSYTLDVGGDIRSSGVMRVDTISGSSFPFTSSIKIPAIKTTGNITVGGNISASGDIIGNSIFLKGQSEGLNFVGSTNDVERIYWDGSAINLAVADNDTLQVHSTGIKVNNNITASGNVSASGTVVGSNLSGTNTGDQSLVHLAVTSSNVLFGNITASNNISSSGTIIANNITAVGIIQAEHFTSTDDAFIADKLTAGTVSSSAFIVDNQTALDTSGTTGRIFVNSTTDTVDIGKAGGALTSIILRSNVTASNNVSASGTVVGSNLSGTNTGDQDLSSYSTITQLNASSSTLQTNINAKSSITQLNASSSTLQTNIDAKAPIANPSFTGNVTSSGNISSSGDIIGNKFLQNDAPVKIHALSGSVSIIKVLPNQFINNPDSGRSPFLDDSVSNTLGVRGHSSVDDLYAFVEIPPLHKVTHVQVHANANTSNAAIARSFNYKTGADNAISETQFDFNEYKAITNIPSTETQDLVIKCTPGANTVHIHGATVTLTLI